VKRPPQLTVRAIRPLVSGLRAMGHDPAPLLSAAGIDDHALTDPDGQVPMAAAVALMEAAAAHTHDADIGLHLAEHAELGSFDVHFYAMASSPTLGDAYQRMRRYQRLIHESSRIEIEERDDTAVLRHVLASGVAAPRHSAEFLISAWVRAGRVVTGLEWAPRHVHFAHDAPADVGEHRRLFAADVRFGMGENALVLPMSLLETPCTRADPALATLLDRYAADRLDHATEASSLADRVRRALADRLRDGEPSASDVAMRLKMSVRTLNRQLTAEGTSYRSVLDALRHELAARYLADDRLSIAEVAFLLGFGELSSFHRAFKRWTGHTPGAFRQRF
jgi:AraC-like DNA-binding protein